MSGVGASRSKWTIAAAVLLLGCLCVVVGSHYYSESSQRDRALAKLAVANGYDVAKYKGSVHLSEKISSGQELSDSEWAEYKELLRNPNGDLRMRNAVYLRRFKNSPRKKDAADEAYRLVDDENPFIQCAAVSALRELGDSRFSQVAAQKVQSGSPQVKKYVQGILARTANANSAKT